MEGAGHTQVFFSLTFLRIKLALFSETSVIMDTAADYYTVNYPWGHLLPHSSSRVDCAPRKQNAAFLQLE